MNPPDHRPPAVVLSGNLGASAKSLNEIALTLTRSLGRQGVPVYRFHPDRSLIDLDSRYCTHVACPNLYDDAAGLNASLIDFAEKQGVKPVIFPASDGAARFLARNEDVLKPHYVLACPTWSCIAEIQDKQQLLERAREANVPVPVTHFPKSAVELDGFAPALSYPVVIKPLTSHEWKRADVVAAIGAVKALVVNSSEELIEAYRKIAPLTPGLMIQEIVPGETERLLTFLGYVDGRGKVIAGCVRKKMRQFPPGFGYCCLTETVHDPEVMDLSVRLLEALRFRGIAGVEFMRDARDGTPKLIEINARAVRTTGAAVGAGVDLPWIAYQDLTSATPVAPKFDYAVPVRWIHLRSEVRAALSLMWRGELRFTEWLQVFRGRKVMAVWAWDDLRPSIANLLLPVSRRIFGLRGKLFRPRGYPACPEGKCVT